VEICDTVFHLIPNMLRVEDYRTAYDEIELAKDHTNVLVTHGLATAIRDKRLATVLITSRSVITTASAGSRAMRGTRAPRSTSRTARSRMRRAALSWTRAGTKYHPVSGN